MDGFDAFFEMSPAAATADECMLIVCTVRRVASPRKDGSLTACLGLRPAVRRVAPQWMMPPRTGPPQVVQLRG